MKKLYLFIVVLLITIGAYAQGTIQGTVVDDNGIPLLGATIMLTATEGMTSDVDGNYSFTNVATGTYSVTAVCLKTHFESLRFSYLEIFKDPCPNMPFKNAGFETV